MDKKWFSAAVMVLMIFTFSLEEMPMVSIVFGQTEARAMDLPAVERQAPGSFADLLYQRSSVRNFSQGTLSLKQVATILFAAQGITRSGRFRTVPSAGALYPLEVYLVAGQVQGLEPGVYKYMPKGHRLSQVMAGDKRGEVARAAYGQTWVARGQAVLVICAGFERVTGKYGERGRRYVHIEAGCAAQNVSLAGFSLGLGSTVVGAFTDKDLATVISAKPSEKPLIIMPVGLLP